jgi:hypothetical protein
LDAEGDGRVVLDLIARLRALLYNPPSAHPRKEKKKNAHNNNGNAHAYGNDGDSGDSHANSTSDASLAAHRHHILRALDARAGAALIADLRAACSPAFGCVGKEGSYRFNHRGTNKELHEYHELVEQGLLHLLRSADLWRQPGHPNGHGSANFNANHAGLNAHARAGPADAVGGTGATGFDAAGPDPDAVAAGALRRLRVFRALRQSYGNTALCLSGGAANGYYHLGVVKALLHYEMLPKIITGSSAGSLIGAAIATRTDMELAAFLDLPAAELADFFQPW